MMDLDDNSDVIMLQHKPADKPAASFSPSITALLDQAAARCVHQGARLTGLRRQVLGLVLSAGRPQGAYELLDRLRALQGRAAPPTVYRALDFLLEQGLVHKLEKLSAFVGCVHGLNDQEHDHAHAAQFLICRGCGAVAEIDDPAIGEALGRAAEQGGFAVLGATVEVDGLCGVCRT